MLDLDEFATAVAGHGTSRRRRAPGDQALHLPGLLAAEAALGR